MLNTEMTKLDMSEWEFAAIPTRLTTWFDAPKPRGC
jgi:hypothetical protein